MLVSSQKLLNNFFAEALLRPSHPLADLKRSEWISHYFSFRNSLYYLTKNCPYDLEFHKLSCVEHVSTLLTLFQKKRDRMSILASIYQNVFKRSSTFVVAVAFGAIGVCRASPLYFLSFKVYYFISLDIGMLFVFSLNVDLTRLQITCGKPKTRESCGR